MPKIDKRGINLNTIIIWAILALLYFAAVGHAQIPDKLLNTQIRLGFMEDITETTVVLNEKNNTIEVTIVKKWPHVGCLVYGCKQEWEVMEYMNIYGIVDGKIKLIKKMEPTFSESKQHQKIKKWINARKNVKMLNLIKYQKIKKCIK